MNNVLPWRSSPKGTAFGGIILSSTKTFETIQRPSTTLENDALTHTSGTGEPCFLKLAVLSLASSIQLFLCLVVVIVDSLPNAVMGEGNAPGGRPYSSAGFA